MDATQLFDTPPFLPFLPPLGPFFGSSIPTGLPPLLFILRSMMHTPGRLWLAVLMDLHDHCLQWSPQKASHHFLPGSRRRRRWRRQQPVWNGVRVRDSYTKWCPPPLTFTPGMTTPLTPPKACLANKAPPHTPHPPPHSANTRTQSVFVDSSRPIATYTKGCTHQRMNICV